MYQLHYYYVFNCAFVTFTSDPPPFDEIIGKEQYQVDCDLKIEVECFILLYFVWSVLGVNT